MVRSLALGIVTLAFIAQAGYAAELVRGVRMKISAGDLATGIAQVEDYKKTSGADAEYLDAVGWLARGAEMLGRSDLARQFVAELRSEIKTEKPELLAPFGAAIEVQAKMTASSEGRGAAIRFLERELAAAQAPALRSRINKNINLLSLEGQPAPPIAGYLDPSRKKPVLLYFFAEWCGDCKAQAATLTRVWNRFRGEGLELISVTRLYGGKENEKELVAKVWKESYPGLENVPVVIDTETMLRYGASATPTFVLIDRRGIVRLYAPTRMSEVELSRRVTELLAETP